MATKAPRFGVIILAAGASTRMGEPKQLMPVGGVPLVLRAAEAALTAEVWPVVIVLGAHAAQIRPLLAKHPVLLADNPAWAEGMASSIRTGVAVLQQFSRSVAGAIVALCDQPGFTSDVIGRLIAEQQATGKGIVAARYSGRNGAPALFVRKHFAALSSLTGEEGARALLNDNTADLAAIDLPQLGIDLDTREDYLRQQSSHLPAG